MTLEEINSKILEIDKQIESLKTKFNQTDKEKQNILNEIHNQIIELSSVENLYYDCRTLLGFASLEELNEQNRKKIELLMPILKQRAETLRKQLENLSLN